MDILLLESRWPSLLKYLHKQGFRKSYIKLFSIEYSTMLKKLKAGLYLSLCDYQDKFIAHHSPTKTTWRRYAAVKKIVRYVLSGEYPITIERMAIEELPEEYQTLIRECIARDKEKGNSPKSQKNYEDSLKTFFIHLYKNGILNLSEATENVVQSYFTCEGKIVRGYNTMMLIKRFLTLCDDCIDGITLEKIRSYLPCIKKKHKLYPALTDNEAQKIKDVLLKDDSGLSELTKAIGCLAFFTGLRTCDIVGLSIRDIDWKDKTIHVVQRKTRVPIHLSLDPVFANHIYRYITRERPQSGDSHIFIRKISRRPMDSHDAYQQCVKIMYKAGIRQVDARRGFHLFRHYLATKMIDNGSNLAIVSATLGHRDPRTTFDYLSSDYKQLKKCALSITNYIRDENY